MRKIRFKELQRLIGMSNSELARWLDVDGRSITRWRGNQEAPKAVILAMKYRAKYGEI